MGLAELERLYGSEHLQPVPGAALLDIEASEIDFRRLGGTIKVAKLLNILPFSQWPKLEKYLADNVPHHLNYLPDGQFTLGLSVYGLDIPVARIHSSLMKLKKIIRQSGRPTRVVPNKSLALSSAQVLHNKLTSRGSWELIFVASGKETYLAQTMFVQDIEAYGARDQVRPKRDSRVGMLPPKLAQIILNLANPRSGSLILDPFCGTGVILQEALLGGFKVIGTDIDIRMVSYAKENLDWLNAGRPELTGKAKVLQADALSYDWEENIGVVASEVFLGRPLSKFPDSDTLDKIIKEVSSTLEGFLKNLARRVKPGTTVSLAVPAWRKPNGQTVGLPVIDHLTDMGYNYLDLKYVRRDEIIYFRENQIVARQLLILEKT